MYKAGCWAPRWLRGPLCQNFPSCIIRKLPYYLDLQTWTKKASCFTWSLPWAPGTFFWMMLGTEHIWHQEMFGRDAHVTVFKMKTIRGIGMKLSHLESKLSDTFWYIQQLSTVDICIVLWTSSQGLWVYFYTFARKVGLHCIVLLVVVVLITCSQHFFHIIWQIINKQVKEKVSC